MITKKVESALIEQIRLEEQSSRIYMAMASWCETNGYPGAAAFLFAHSDEERLHMTKLVGYVNDRGGHTILKALEMPDNEYTSLLDVFQKVLKHEEFVTSEINNLYGLVLKEGDYLTGQFLQWYIAEQIEEESLFHSILDKINLTGEERGGIFHIDKELKEMAVAETAGEQA